MTMKKSFDLAASGHITNEDGITSITMDTAGHNNIITDEAMMTGEAKAMTISCHDLNYVVSVKPNACGKSHEKVILQNITGIFPPGMNAILGPTGSGKTSLLDILAGRKDPRGVRGTILVDGHKQPRNFKCDTGYVVQDDVVMGTLTIRENITFSANVRLPLSVSRRQKARRVDHVISELGLTLCADTRVGTEFTRGVSGGERKRTNIAMELIISPPVLFLDEPTTGLDASTANAVMALLHRLSRNGKTIIFSIHQPRYSIYKQFDSLVLLALGRTVYQGQAAQALQYFEDIGYHCEPHNNPPDFFLDVTNGDSTCIAIKSEDPVPMVNSGVTAAAWPGDDMSIASTSDGTGKETLAEILMERFTRSTCYSKMKQEADELFQQYAQTGSYERTVKGQYATSFSTQLKYVGKRAITNLYRNPQTSFVQIIVTTVFAVIVGLIFLRIDKDLMPAAIQNRVGAMFFIIMNQIFTNLSAIELFIKERNIFIHENSSGFYRVSAYFIAKVTCDVIPMRALPIIIFSSISYFMIGFRLDVGRFFFYVLNLFLTTITAASIGIFMGASFRVHAIANLMSALIYVFMMVFSGLLVNLRTMGAWLSWIKYLSIFRYSLNALSVSQLKDLELCVEEGSPGNSSLYCDTTFGNTYMDEQGIAYSTTWDLWVNELALGAIALGVMCFTWVRLVLLNKYK